MTSSAPITIVSGLPRSGTSLMMQMLQAGGMPILTDQIRAPDEDNPRGYLEFERVKKIGKDKSWLTEAEGKAVKMVHLLLYELPSDRSYRVIFMRRNLDEVLASQRKMLQRQGKSGARMSDEQLHRIFEEQVNKILRWLSQRPNFMLMEVNYQDLVRDPKVVVPSVNRFLGAALNESAMTAVVDPALYRNRVQQ